MNAMQPIETDAKPVKLRAKLSRALDVIAVQGQTQREAARRAGIHEDSLSRALARPEVKRELERRQAEAALSLTALQGMAKASAIRVGLDLMHNSADDRVKARMVELFAGEARQAGVAVQVNVPQFHGYAYHRPDTVSEADMAQAIDGTAQPGKPE
jgi:lambda repressor-like predicted transcriptional regulator